jgi:hypothetical protein
VDYSSIDLEGQVLEIVEGSGFHHSLEASLVAAVAEPEASSESCLVALVPLQSEKLGVQAVLAVWQQQLDVPVLQTG